MKIIHTSDWHLGKSLYDFSLIEDQRFVIDEIIDIASGEHAGAVVIAGDIYDRPTPSVAAAQLYDYFLSRVVGDMGIPVIAIAGNHDSAGRLEFGSSLYKTAGYYVYGSHKRDISPVKLRDAWGEVRFYPLPYLHPAEIRAFFPEAGIKSFDDAYRVILSHNAGAVESGFVNIAVAHGFFAGLAGKADRDVVTSGSEVSVGGMDIADTGHFSAFDYAALGHLHAPQDAGGRARYSGSPMKYSLSEENQVKSVTIIDTAGNAGVEAYNRPLKQPRGVRTVHGDFAMLCDPLNHSGSFEDYIFAEISGGAAAYPMEKLRLVFPNLLGLAFTEAMGGKPEVKLAARGGQAPSEELFIRFYEEMKGTEMPGDILEELRAVIAGMAGEGDI